jgi:hypothetical protein
MLARVIRAMSAMKVVPRARLGRIMCRPKESRPSRGLT